MAIIEHHHDKGQIVDEMKSSLPPRYVLDPIFV